jgi:PAS domain S-box-containing protein
VNFIDIRTVVAVQTALFGVCTLVMFALWSQNRGRFAGPGFWTADYLLQAVAMVLIGLQGRAPDLVGVVLANTLVLAGVLLMNVGLQRFLKRPGAPARDVALLALFAVVHAYFTFVQPSLAARHVNVSLALLILCAQGYWLLTCKVEPALRSAGASAALVLAAFCGLSVVRIVVAVLDPRYSGDYLHSGPFQALVLVAYQMLFVLLTFSLVLLVNGRLLAEVRAGEEKYLKVFHSAPYAILLTRLADGKILEVNDGFLKTTGYQAVEVIGRTTTELRLWESAEQRALVIAAVAAGAAVRDAECRFRMKSGLILVGLFSAEVIVIDGERWLLSSISDITERVRAEEALRESEERYRQLNAALEQRVSERTGQLEA